MEKSRIEKRLEDEDKVLISPIASQLGGALLSLSLFLLGVIVYENTVAEWSNWFWVWVWRILCYALFAKYTIKFFQAGLEPLMAVGTSGIPRFFGRPVERVLYKTGRHWTIPGKGNKMVTVDMRSESINLNITVTTKDMFKMVCPLSLNYWIYDPHIFVEVKEFKKTFESMISGAFLDFSSERTAKDMLDMNKATILEAVKKSIEEIEGEGYKIEDFGIETQKDTIAIADGFDFGDPRSREAFELEGREKKERAGQTVEMDHLTTLAKKIVDESKGTMSFAEALIRTQQNYGKNAPDEKVVRFEGLPSALTDWLNKNTQKP